MALSVSSIRFVSFTNVTQATGLRHLPRRGSLPLNRPAFAGRTSRRTPETGHNDCAGVRCQIHGPPSQAAIPNVENVPRQSYVPTHFDRFLHGTHDLVRNSVRLRCARTSSSTRGPFQCHGSSDGGVDRAAIVEAFP